MAVDTILSNPLVKDFILPFLLVFAIVFAILQKSEILGKGKKQTDAIIALVVGLLVVAVGTTVPIINNLLPILAVGLVALLSFFLLWGFAFKEGEFFKNIPAGVQWAIGGISAIVVVVAVLYYTKGFEYLKSLSGGNGEVWLTNLFFVVVIIIAIAAVVGFGGGSAEKKKE